MNTKTCPRCKGEKQIYRQIMPSIYTGWYPCETCNATGIITEEKQAILDLAQMIRETRNKTDVSLREIALQLNCTAPEWQKIEWGEASLEATRHALLVVEGIKANTVEMYDVYLWESSSKRSKVKTCVDKTEAEIEVQKIKANLRAVGVAGVCEIVERMERVIG